MIKIIVPNLINKTIYISGSMSIGLFIYSIYLKKNINTQLLQNENKYKNSKLNINNIVIIQDYHNRIKKCKKYGSIMFLISLLCYSLKNI